LAGSVEEWIGAQDVEKSFDIVRIVVTKKDQVLELPLESAFLTVYRQQGVTWQVEIFTSDATLEPGDYRVEMMSVSGRDFRGRARLQHLVPVGDRGGAGYLEGLGRLIGFDIAELDQ
jgi:hypothetical protein